MNVVAAVSNRLKAIGSSSIKGEAEGRKGLKRRKRDRRKGAFGVAKFFSPMAVGGDFGTLLQLADEKRRECERVEVAFHARLVSLSPGGSSLSWESHRQSGESDHRGGKRGEPADDEAPRPQPRPGGVSLSPSRLAVAGREHSQHPISPATALGQQALNTPPGRWPTRLCSPSLERAFVRSRPSPSPSLSLSSPTPPQSVSFPFPDGVSGRAPGGARGPQFVVHPRSRGRTSAALHV